MINRFVEWLDVYALLIFLIFFLLMLLALIALLVYGIVVLDSDGWVKLLSNMFSDLPSAIILAVAYSILMKIIGEILPRRARLKVQPEDDLISTKKLFGYGFFKRRVPKTIKLLSLTGEEFLWDYSKNLVKALDEGVEVRLMIASPTEENYGFLERHSAIHRGDNYIKKIQEDSFERIAKIMQATKNPQNFTVRFFLDEYQNNLQIAKYELPSPKTYCWISLVPMHYRAFSLSVEFRNRWYRRNMRDWDSFFDFLWKKYEESELVIEWSDDSENEQKSSLENEVLTK